MTRLLQDDTQTHDSKGLPRWLSSRPDSRRIAREAAEEITEAQIEAQDSMWGIPKEMKE